MPDIGAPKGSEPLTQLAENGLIAEILDDVADAVVVRDPTGTILFWNAAAEKLYGWSRRDVMGSDADALLNSRPVFTAIPKGQSDPVEISRVAADRRNVVVLAEFKSRLNQNGGLRYIVETARDVTTERAARRASMADEARYRTLFHAMTAAFLEIDMSRSLTILAGISAEAVGDVRDYILANDALFDALIESATVVEVNDRVQEILGYGGEESLNTLSPMWTVESRSVFVEMLLARARGTPRLTAEIHLRKQDGTDLFGIVTACLNSTGVGEGRILLGVIDTTELKHANAAVERSREHHEALFHHMPIALCRVNGDALTEFYSTFRQEPDIDIEAFIEQNPAIVEKVCELCYIEEANPQAISLLGGKSAEDLVGRPIGFAWRQRPDSLIKLIASGIKRTNCEMETQLETLDGRLIDVLFASATIHTTGSRLSVIGMINIGDRLAAQDAFGKLQSEFAHASRISLLGELSASIAHEISQPLAAIATTGSTGLRWLDQTEPKVEQARSSLDKIVSYAQRASGIIARVRKMASGRTPVMSAEPINEVVAGALQLIEAQARSNQIEIKFRPMRTCGFVHVDRTQIEQVVVNLVVNAIQAIANAAADHRMVEIEITTQGSDAVCFVTDSGPGISPDRVDSVFERFVSSKAEGTGLGLALCRSIIHAHGGEITVDGHSQLGGARFSFTLPLWQGRPGDRVVPAPSHD